MSSRDCVGLTAFALVVGATPELPLVALRGSVAEARCPLRARRSPVASVDARFPCSSPPRLYWRLPDWRLDALARALALLARALGVSLLLLADVVGGVLCVGGGLGLIS